MDGIAIPLPGLLLSSDGDRGVKGMPVPSKKLGGLSNKIRSVSKIMVSARCDSVLPEAPHEPNRRYLICFLLPREGRMSSKGT